MRMFFCKLDEVTGRETCHLLYVHILIPAAFLKTGCERFGETREQVQV